MHVEDVVERVYRRFLAPMFDQPISSVLTATIDASQPFLTVAAFATTEYSDALATGTIIECGYELMRIVSVAGGDQEGDPVELTVARAVYGTPATAHLQGSEVVVAPFVPRHDVLELVYDEIESLYPNLWVTKNADLGVDAPFDLPADFGELIRPYFVDFNGNEWPMRSAKAVLTVAGTWKLNISSGTEFGLFASYAAKPIRPDSFTNNLEDVNVLPRWVEIIALGVASSVVGGSNVSRLRADYLTEMVETQLSEQVSPARIAALLRQLQGQRIMNERDRLRAELDTETYVATLSGI